ncbi:MAG: pyridoxal phosphate-dependent aminotransferase [Sporomusaceae bacterium]|nr:pyridoxal phosphate-dependent aminotransferase [Sporomusaceae bacterium]
MQHVSERKLATRLNKIQVPSFKELGDLAMHYQAVDLGSGKPDYPTEEKFKEAAIDAIQRDCNQYAPTMGLKSLRQGIATRIAAKWNVSFDFETEITVCSGVTESLTAAFLALLDPGDEVIILSPAFASYQGGILLAGGKPIYVDLIEPDFHLNIAKVAAAITPKTKAILFNSPHNPSGRIFTREETEAVAQLVRDYDLFVITDEIYDDFYYQAEPPLPIWTLPGLREKTILTNGFSKVYAVTGWRLGYVIAPPIITKEIRKVHQYLTLSSALPFQISMVEALQVKASYYEKLRVDYKRRLSILTDAFEELKIPYVKPDGGYFVLADFSRFGIADDWDFARYLIETVGLAARPLSGFYFDDQVRETGRVWLRFAFCMKESVLQEAVVRLKKLEQVKGEARYD